MPFNIKFYTDVTRYHDTTPCERHQFVYSTLEETEMKARSLLHDVRKKHGATVGWAITEVETGHTWSIGPGVDDND